MVVLFLYVDIDRRNDVRIIIHIILTDNKRMSPLSMHAVLTRLAKYNKTNNEEAAASDHEYDDDDDGGGGGGGSRGIGDDGGGAGAGPTMFVA